MAVRLWQRCTGLIPLFLLSTPSVASAASTAFNLKAFNVTAFKSPLISTLDWKHCRIITQEFQGWSARAALGGPWNGFGLGRVCSALRFKISEALAFEASFESGQGCPWKSLWGCLWKGTRWESNLSFSGPMSHGVLNVRYRPYEAPKAESFLGGLKNLRLAQSVAETIEIEDCPCGCPKADIRPVLNSEIWKVLDVNPELVQKHEFFCWDEDLCGEEEKVADQIYSEFFDLWERVQKACDEVYSKSGGKNFSVSGPSINSTSFINLVLKGEEARLFEIKFLKNCTEYVLKFKLAGLFEAEGYLSIIGKTLLQILTLGNGKDYCSRDQKTLAAIEAFLEKRYRSRMARWSQNFPSSVLEHLRSHQADFSSRTQAVAELASLIPSAGKAYLSLSDFSMPFFSKPCAEELLDEYYPIHIFKFEKYLFFLRDELEEIKRSTAEKVKETLKLQASSPLPCYYYPSSENYCRSTFCEYKEVFEAHEATFLKLVQHPSSWKVSSNVVASPYCYLRKPFSDLKMTKELNQLRLIEKEFKEVLAHLEKKSQVREGEIAEKWRAEKLQRSIEWERKLAEWREKTGEYEPEPQRYYQRPEPPSRFEEFLSQIPPTQVTLYQSRNFSIGFSFG